MHVQVKKAGSLQRACELLIVAGNGVDGVDFKIRSRRRNAHNPCDLFKHVRVEPDNVLERMADYVVDTDHDRELDQQAAASGGGAVSLRLELCHFPLHFFAVVRVLRLNLAQPRLKAHLRQRALLLFDGQRGHQQFCDNGHQNDRKAVALRELVAKFHQIPDRYVNDIENTAHYYLQRCSFGTGSYPPLEKGLHRKNLAAASRLPFITPWISSASIAYCEQVGMNLQAGGVREEMLR